MLKNKISNKSVAVSTKDKNKVKKLKRLISTTIKLIYNNNKQISVIAGVERDVTQTTHRKNK